MKPAQDKSATVLLNDSLVPLEAILCTEELNRRPTRPPDYETENRALAALVQALADSPRTILQTLADTILEVFKADSAGMSLLMKDEKRFEWAAIAGAWQPHLGGGTPRDFGPCGDVLDCNAPLLFRHWERRYPYLMAATPPAVEGLLIPFHVAGKAVGTIWAITHDAPPDRRKFDAEDLRQLVSLGRFASAAYQSLELRQAQDSRRAALNLLEVADQSRLATERLNMELRESEQRYRTLFDLGPVAVYSCDVSGMIQKFNRRAAELWGREPVPGDTDERFCGSFKMIRPNGIVMPHEQCPMAEVLSGKISEARDSEVLIERPDGSRVAVIVNIRPVKNQRGEITEAINCFYDITERKQIEDALRESEARYRTLFASAPMAIFVCDRNAVIQYHNQHAVDLWGREPVCGVEQHCGSLKLWLPDGTLLPHEQSPMVEVLRTGVPAHNVEVFIERPDGSRLPVLVNFAALKNARGEITGAVTSFIDITERKQIEDALREAGERKNEFLAMLAHELRNPLAPIRNMLEIMKREDGRGDSILQARQTIERQLGQMTRLIDDLLDVSRISRGKLDLRREQVELASVVHQVVEACRPAMESANHVLTVTLPPQGVCLNADSVRLAQVFGNLLNNAAKYTEPGGRIEFVVSVEEQMSGEWRVTSGENDESGGERLTTRRSPLDTAFAVIRVRDTGLGIPPDMLPKIFEMFTQVDQSLERSQGGLGIGLTLVRRLVELHGGTVEVYSAGIGQGSEFVVRLPIIVETPALQPPPSQPPEPTVGESTPTTACRILVVDDNQDSAMSLAMLLKLTGNETHTAHDGLAAVDAAEVFKPDVVLLDIGLPKLNGYDACRKIREQPQGKGMVLIALTGWGQDEDRRKSKDAGFDGHLVKPVDFNALTKLLAELLPTPV